MVMEDERVVCRSGFGWGKLRRRERAKDEPKKFQGEEVEAWMEKCQQAGAPGFEACDDSGIELLWDD